MKNDLEKIEKYEPYFRSAIYYDYIRALWENDMKVLISIYEKWTGVKYTGCTTCGKSKLQFMKKLGELYFKNKEKMEKENGENTEQGSKGKGKVCSRTDSKRKQPKNSNGKVNGKV